MKLHIILVLVFVMVIGVSNHFAQPPGPGTPPGAGDKNLGDNDIKLRSVELERIKREAQAAEAASYAPINPKIAGQFGQVKDDYEAIQLLQAAIIKAYTTGKSIDYAMIETCANDMKKRALRLDSNLFAASKTDRIEKNADGIETKSEVKKEKTLSIRDLIVELDNAVGDFVSSKIFGKLKVIEPIDAIKTRDDLSRVLKFSESLSNEAKKMK